MPALSVSRQVVLNAYWIPLNFQNAALLTIAVPAALLRFRGIDHIAELALLASLVAVISMIVPPVFGEISDRLHRAGSPRRWMILIGAVVNAGALLWMAVAPSPNVFAMAVIVATLGQNVSTAAYSALIPEVVPREEWGAASGYQGVGTLVGTIAGLIVASVAPASTMMLAAAAVVFVGALTVFAVPEGRFVEGEHAHVSDWANFAIAFFSRFWTFFGLVLLNTFVLYFFQDVLKVSNPSAGTGFVGVMAMVGAIASSVLMGYVSDRVPRKWVVALAGVPMALAAIGFAFVPQERWILIFAIFFGLGYGAFVSTGWALAIDSVPKLGNVARDLGIWGIAANLPAIFAPQAGKWILGSYATPLAGYRALFVAAGVCFALGSIVVLWTGRRRQVSLLPASGGPLQAFAMAVIHPYYLTAYRIRGWGRLPRRRGATLAISNHQHDLDTTGVIMRLSVQGPWRHPIYAVTSRRLFEPGFMGVRLAWLEPVVRNMNWGWLFGLIGMLPIENELRRRSVASLAWWVYLRHGDLLFSEVFRDGTGAGALGTGDGASLLSLFAKEKYKPARDAYVSIAALREPYRSEVVEQTRAYLTGDLDRIESVLRGGGTLYLTPEGRYSKDGRIGRFREAIDRLAHLGTVYVLPVSYDPFVGRRLSLLYRVLAAQDPSDLRSSLAAPRPVTTSQLIATWIVDRGASFSGNDMFAGVLHLRRLLPANAFIDPELDADSAKMVNAAIATMSRLGILQRDGDRYRLSNSRRHPQFPDVADIVRHQANFFQETLDALGRLDSHALRARSSTD